MRGFIWGVCVVLFGGACMVLFGGHAWFFFGGGVWFFQFFSYNEIQSMSRRYAFTEMHSCVDLLSDSDHI